jgi:hypothetical protein
MKALVAIDFACNDPDNGEFAGRVDQAHYAEADLEGDCLKGYAFEVRDGMIRIHRRQFRFIERKFWVGNWCWDSFWFSRPVAKQLLGTMRRNGRWRCGDGPTRFFDWWNGQTA